MKKIILILIVLGMGIALGVYIQKQPKTDKLETKIQADARQAGDDVKAGEQKVDVVAADIKTDAQKVRDAATNEFGEVKGKLP